MNIVNKWRRRRFLKEHYATHRHTTAPHDLYPQLVSEMCIDIREGQVGGGDSAFHILLYTDAKCEHLAEAYRFVDIYHLLDTLRATSKPGLSLDETLDIIVLAGVREVIPEALR